MCAWLVLVPWVFPCLVVIASPWPCTEQAAKENGWMDGRTFPLSNSVGSYLYRSHIYFFFFPFIFYSVYITLRLSSLFWNPRHTDKLTKEIKGKDKWHNTWCIPVLREIALCFVPSAKFNVTVSFKYHCLIMMWNSYLFLIHLILRALNFALNYIVSWRKRNKLD